jgi:hypothetical protein
MDVGGLRPSGACGYADLLLSYVTGGLAEMNGLAGMLGYERLDVREVPPSSPDITLPASDRQQPEPDALPEFTEPQTATLPFWQPHHYHAPERQTVAPAAPEQDPEKPWRGLRTEAPAGQPIAAWSEIAPRGRQAFASPVETAAPDLDAVVRWLARGQLLHRMPRRRRRRWGERVQIIVDDSVRLTPFFADQQTVFDHLVRLFPRHGIEFAALCPGDDAPTILSRHHPPKRYQIPEPGTLVIVLGDLGCLAPKPETATSYWADLGRRLVQAECRPVALNPCPPGRWLTGPLRSWTIVPWDRRSAAVSYGSVRTRAGNNLRSDRRPRSFRRLAGSPLRSQCDG